MNRTEVHDLLAVGVLKDLRLIGHDELVAVVELVEADRPAVLLNLGLREVLDAGGLDGVGNELERAGQLVGDDRPAGLGVLHRLLVLNGIGDDVTDLVLVLVSRLVDRELRFEQVDAYDIGVDTTLIVDVQVRFVVNIERSPVIVRDAGRILDELRLEDELVVLTTQTHVLQVALLKLEAHGVGVRHGVVTVESDGASLGRDVIAVLVEQLTGTIDVLHLDGEQVDNLEITVVIAPTAVDALTVDLEVNRELDLIVDGNTLGLVRSLDRRVEIDGRVIVKRRRRDVVGRQEEDGLRSSTVTVRRTEPDTHWLVRRLLVEVHFGHAVRIVLRLVRGQRQGLASRLVNTIEHARLRVVNHRRIVLHQCLGGASGERELLPKVEVGRRYMALDVRVALRRASIHVLDVDLKAVNTCGIEVDAAKIVQHLLLTSVEIGVWSGFSLIHALLTIRAALTIHARISHGLPTKNANSDVRYLIPVTRGNRRPTASGFDDLPVDNADDGINGRALIAATCHAQREVVTWGVSVSVEVPAAILVVQILGLLKLFGDLATPIGICGTSELVRNLLGPQQLRTALELHTREVDGSVLRTGVVPVLELALANRLDRTRIEIHRRVNGIRRHRCQSAPNRTRTEQRRHDDCLGALERLGRRHLVHSVTRTRAHTVHNAPRATTRSATIGRVTFHELSFLTISSRRDTPGRVNVIGRPLPWRPIAQATRDLRRRRPAHPGMACKTLPMLSVT